jgi:hypothetical protein
MRHRGGATMMRSVRPWRHVLAKDISTDCLIILAMVVSEQASDQRLRTTLRYPGDRRNRKAYLAFAETESAATLRQGGVIQRDCEPLCILCRLSTPSPPIFAQFDASDMGRVDPAGSIQLPFVPIRDIFPRRAAPSRVCEVAGNPWSRAALARYSRLIFSRKSFDASH